jgi:purine nucleosidase
MGIDDALALLYLLRSPEVQLEAITTVHGNVPVEQATRNVFEVLSVANQETQPEVARGSGAALERPYVHARDVHGTAGLGGWTIARVHPAFQLSQLPAAELILQMAKKRPGEIRLLLVGPATNAALAFRQNPEGFRLLKDIVMMAGAVWEPGNTTATAEFNVYADPEAAREVLHAGVPITLVGLDVTRRVRLTRQRIETELGNRSDMLAEFLRCITAHGFAFYNSIGEGEGMYLHDPLAAGIVVDSSFVETRRVKVDIETEGELTRGMLVAERRLWKKGGENANVCVYVDSARFMTAFSERVLCAV